MLNGAFIYKTPANIFMLYFHLQTRGNNTKVSRKQFLPKRSFVTYNYTRAFFCRSKLDISMRILLSGNLTKKLPLKKSVGRVIFSGSFLSLIAGNKTRIINVKFTSTQKKKLECNSVDIYSYLMTETKD
jgi:DNA topoisomerase IA